MRVKRPQQPIGPRLTVIRGYRDDYPRTAPVESLPQQIGDHDLGGNVWEPCADWYDQDRRHAWRLVRARFWTNGLRSSARMLRVNGLSFLHIGFRVVLTAP